MKKKQNSEKRKGALCVLFWCIFLVNFVMCVQTVSANENDSNPEAEIMPIVVDIYHQHTGSAAGGGCYGQHHSRTENIICNKPYTQVAWNKIVCSVGHGQSNNVDNGYNSYPIPSGCDEVLSSRTVSWYTINCGKSTNLLGHFTLKPSTKEWAREVTMEASYHIIDTAMKVKESPYSWNGEEGVRENKLLIQNNRIVHCKLLAEAGSSSGDANLSYEIKNIDRKGPTIQTISYDKDVYSTGKQIVVGAIDIQENGEEGSGLDQYPFALDEGDWQEENSFLVESNGIHMIRVMDRLGNIQEQEFEVSMIDREGPIIQSSSVSPEESTLGNVVLTIEAIDLNGIGLHEMAFSFDGGNTWGAENSIVLTKNQMIPVVVRDKLENKTEKKIHITNIIVPETDNQKKEEESQSEEAPQNIEQGEIPLVTATPISVISERKYPVKAVTEQDELERNKENQNLNKEERQEKELEKRGAEPEQVTIENVADYSNNRRQKVIIALTLIAILTLVLFGGMLLNYFYYNIVLIYEISDGDQERYLGMTFLRKKETFYLTISKKICDKSNTIFYRLKLSEIVDNRHHAETLFIITEHEKFTYSISDAIDFTLEK